MADNLFTDEDFADSLVSLLCRDPKGLREVAVLLGPDDFKPVKGMRNAFPRQTVAELALEHWGKHREPLGRLFTSTVTQYANDLNLGEHRVQQLKEYCSSLTKGEWPAP